MVGRGGRGGFGGSEANPVLLEAFGPSGGVGGKTRQDIDALRLLSEEAGNGCAVYECC